MNSKKINFKILGITLAVMVCAMVINIAFMNYTQKLHFVYNESTLVRKDKNYTKAHSLALDTDKDGVSDRNEINIFHSDPNKTDTDNDGYNDLTEIANCYNPNSQNKELETTVLPNQSGKIQFFEVNNWKMRSLRYFADDGVMSVLDSWVISDGNCLLDGPAKPVNNE